MNIKKHCLILITQQPVYKVTARFTSKVKRNRSSYLELKPTRSVQPVSFRFWYDEEKQTKSWNKVLGWGWDQTRNGSPTLILSQLRPYPTITLFGSAISREPIKFKTKEPEHCCRHGNGSFPIWLTSMITNRFKPDLDRWYHSYSDDVTPSHHSYWQMYTMQSVFVNKDRCPPPRGCPIT